MANLGNVKKHTEDIRLEDYSPLLESDSLPEAQAIIRAQRDLINSSSRRTKILIISLCVAFALNLAFIVQLSLQRNYDPSIQTYSPARSAVEYNVVNFHRGFGKDTPIYERLPSPEVDRAWKDLYEEFTTFRLSQKEAEKAVNKTQILWKSEGYMAGLDVFHQLHCLDMLRMALHPQDYPNLDLPPGHMRHCVGVMRQSIMCAADISIDVWQWSDKVHRVASRTDVLHTCRNFEKLQDWVRERTILSHEWTNEDFALHVDETDVLAGHHDH